MTDFKMNTGCKDEWSAERQMQEVARRWGFYREMENHQELSFTPLPNDVIVAVPQKCGTTWLLHICHQIRMRGAEPDFKSQADVITWIELAERVYKVDPATLSVMPQVEKNLNDLLLWWEHRHDDDILMLFLMTCLKTMLDVCVGLPGSLEWIAMKTHSLE